jgi:1-acyl-sn-glycerol-3-phosphate acyltransferase
MYEVFDGAPSVARLPGPPYHFMSRVNRIDGPIGVFKPGAVIELEYDVPRDAWYFDENGSPTMPFCVLLGGGAAALRLAGELRRQRGARCPTRPLFRNLDGTGTMLAEIGPEVGVFRTRVKITKISHHGGHDHRVVRRACFVGETQVYDWRRSSASSPRPRWRTRSACPPHPKQRAILSLDSDVRVDLKPRPRALLRRRAEAARVDAVHDRPGHRLVAEGGAQGPRRARAEKDVDAKSSGSSRRTSSRTRCSPGARHRGDDPPAAVGDDREGHGGGHGQPPLRALEIGGKMGWKYRGQVVPTNKLISSDHRAHRGGRDERGPFAIATRAVGRRQAHLRGDHRPTWTIAALPMMSAVDLLAGEAARATGRTVVGVRAVNMKRWITVPDGETVRVKLDSTGDGASRECSLSVWRDAADPKLSRFELAAKGSVLLADRYPDAPAAFAALADGVDDGDPYESGALFHGPAFRCVTRLLTGAAGATAELDLARCAVPYGALHQGVLDALTHAIPHDALHRWSSEIASDLVAYPYTLDSLEFYGPIPTEGLARVEARFDGFEQGDKRFPAIALQLVSADGRVIASARLVEILLPKGPIGTAPRAHRVAFLRDRRFVPGVSLSREEAGISLLDRADAASSDWLPNNLATIYQVEPGKRAELFTHIAAKEHIARRAFVHPSRVKLIDGDSPEPSVQPITGEVADLHGVADVRPLRAHPVRVSTDEQGRTRVSDARASRMDLAPIRRYWDKWFGIGPWFGEDLHYGLIKKFVGDVVLADPDSFAKLRGRSCLFLANHQVGVESLLFSVIAAGLTEQPVVTLAKAEHRDSWLGHFINHAFTYPGVQDPRLITFFEREDREVLLQIVAELAGELASGARSVMVHVEGTRSVTCRTPVIKMSSAFIDMALSVKVPIVPVRFVGGIPSDPPLETRLEFPLGYGRQDYWFGRPILPEELEAMPYKDRKATVLAAINGLGPGCDREEPYPGDAVFERTVAEWCARTGANPEHAAILSAVLSYAKSHDTEALAQAIRAGEFAPGDSAKAQWMKTWARWFFGPTGPRVR